MQTAPYFTAFGLLAIMHSLRVSQLRRKYRVLLGDGGHEDLALRIRVFGNFVEYVPLGLVFLIALEVVQAPAWFMHLAGFTLLGGRIFHAAGLGNRDLKSQFFGMVLTHTSILVAALGISFWAFFMNGAY